MQCPVLKYQLVLKTAPIQGTPEDGMDDGFQHILSGVIFSASCFIHS